MTDMQASGETWRYEIRGSSLYDLTEERALSLAEAGELLNAHQHLLIQSGIWAAKAGLAEGKLARQASGERQTWHFLDKRSKALARNSDGLKLEFATHQDAEIGRRVLAALEADRDRLQQERDDYEGRNKAEYYRNEELSELLSETARLGYEEAERLRLRAEAAEADRDALRRERDGLQVKVTAAEKHVLGYLLEAEHADLTRRAEEAEALIAQMRPVWDAIVQACERDEGDSIDVIKVEAPGDTYPRQYLRHYLAALTAAASKEPDA